MEFTVSRPVLLKFVRRNAYDGKNGEVARMFVLKRTTGGKPVGVDDWAVATNFDADRVVDAIIEAAEEDCKGISDAQSYELQAYFGTSKVAGRRKTFEIDPSAFDDDDELEERVKRGRDGSAKSLVQQAQRHNEAYAKMHILGTGELVKILRAQVSDLMEQVRHKDETISGLVNGHVDSVKRQADLTESLLNQDHKRQLEKIEKEGEVEMKRGMLKMLEPLGQKAVLQLGSKLLGPSDDEPDPRLPPNPALAPAPTSDKPANTNAGLSRYAQVILALEETFTNDTFLKVVNSGVFNQQQIGFVVELFRMAKAENAAQQQPATNGE